MESTRIGTGERKKYTKAAYKKAGGNRMEENCSGSKRRERRKLPGTICIMSSTCVGFMWLR